MRRLLLLSMLVAGCTSPASTEVLPNAVLPHASFRALVLDQFGLSPAAGFSFRAETEAGEVIEGTIDANGLAPAELDALEARWDLTLARPRSAALSILGIEGPLQGDLLIHASEHDQRASRELTVNVDGVADLPQQPFTFCPGAYFEGSSARIPVADGESTLDVWAIQSETRLSGAPLVNVARTGPFTLGADDTTLTLHFPSPAPTSIHDTVRLQLPSSGLLTPTTWPTPEPGRSWRGGDASPACVAANVAWTAPDATGVATWTIDALDVEGTQPTTLSIAGGSASFNAVLQVHSITDGALVTFAPLTSVPTTVDDGGWPRLNANGSEVDFLQLVATTGEANVHAEWDAYTFDASTTDHRLPSLPTGIEVGDLIQGYGFGAVTTLAAFTCGLRLASGPPPWAPGSSFDLQTCEATTFRFGSQ